MSISLSIYLKSTKAFINFFGHVTVNGRYNRSLMLHNIHTSALHPNVNICINVFTINSFIIQWLYQRNNTLFKTNWNQNIFLSLHIKQLRHHIYDGRKIGPCSNTFFQTFHLANANKTSLTTVLITLSTVWYFLQRDMNDVIRGRANCGNYIFNILP